MSKGESMNNKLISLKAQIVFMFVPCIGCFLVIITSFYNILKERGAKFLCLYYLLTIVPTALLYIFYGMVYDRLIVGYDLPVKLALCLLSLWSTSCALAFYSLLLEKLFIKTNK
jgi:hypothetical protein